MGSAKTKDRSLSLRLYVFAAFMLVWAGCIATRLYFLHVVESADYREMADRQQKRTLEITPRRGVIYDRNGNELAVSIKVDSVFAVPREIRDPKYTARVLSDLTGRPAADLLTQFQSERSFVWIKRKISAPEASAIESAELPGIYFQEEDRRYYPKRQMAAHVLGYVNVDEEGMGGLEYRYDSSVRGESGKVVVMTDARGKSYQSIEQAPQPGANLITTIDENIQFILEREIQDAAASTRAAGISIVAMDPHTGEVLGMASYPTFNPNEHNKSQPQAKRNRAVNQVYEPGSTFKIATVAAALEEKLTTPEEMIDCQNGSIVLYGHRINDHKPFGVLSVREIMQHSSDVGVIKLGLRLGDERFARFIERVGFGRPTAIDLPGEERGLTKPAEKWSRVSVGAISMGQEIATTPLQIVSLVSAVANGGILYQPYVVQRVEHPERGTLSETEPHGVRVMSRTTAQQLRDMLEIVVTDGTAQAGQLDGYRAAGKTGTAQKIDETGSYSKTKYVASFAGYAPASNPVVSIIVVLDEPVGLHGGGAVAAPIFKRIAQQVLRYKTVMPDDPQYAPRYTAPDTRETPVERAAPLQFAEGQVLDTSFTGFPGENGGYEFGDITVPDFSGKSLREVTGESLRLGLRLQSTGSGRSAKQDPAAGIHVRAGTTVRVQFSAK